VPHLPADEFPPLADYDFGSNLMKKSFPVSNKMNDVFSFSTRSLLHVTSLLSTWTRNRGGFGATCFGDF